MDTPVRVAVLVPLGYVLHGSVVVFHIGLRLGDPLACLLATGVFVGVARIMLFNIAGVLRGQNRR